MSRRIKKLILALVDMGLFAVAFMMSYYFLSIYVEGTLRTYLTLFLVVYVSYLVLGERLHIFSRLNRYTSVNELITLGVAISCANLLGLVARIIFPHYFSIRIVILSYLFSILLLGASRIAWRYAIEYRTKRLKGVPRQKRTLVIGAGDGANILFSRLRTEHEIYHLVGAVDDDPNKKGTYIHGRPVLGTLLEMSDLINSRNIEHVIVAIPSLDPLTLEHVINTCRGANVTVNTLPPIHEVLGQDFTIKKLRDIDITDLLGRKEVKLDMEKISHALTGKTLLVTGAGGSIGSEICRQIAKFSPKRLILLGHGENSIYLIHRELVGLYKDMDIVPLIADVQDREKMFSVMKHYRPDKVYHAAAHKHVPLMEANPIESVKNNVFGTKNVAEAAKAAGVENFVMVSTDKAVNPPNVMGATKRIAEMIVTGLNEQGSTNFSAVRFGNVLGSRGSVVPLFKDQIAKGGPVTVTDFRMTRYFMTIPEAARLVIQSGTLARGGEVFVLDMGEPVKIVDLAKKVIALSGFSEEQIQIVESGIRPGEKLYEELLLSSETTNKNVFEKIFIGKVPNLPYGEVMNFVDSLEDNDVLRDRLVGFANNLGEKPKVKELHVPRVDELEALSELKDA